MRQEGRRAGRVAKRLNPEKVPANNLKSSLGTRPKLLPNQVLVNPKVTHEAKSDCRANEVQSQWKILQIELYH